MIRDEADHESTNIVNPETSDLAYARSLDSKDPLARFRSEFIIPTVADLHRPTLQKLPNEEPSGTSLYFCGNSLGPQPRRVRSYIDTHLFQWSSKGVTGHFVEHSDSTLVPFLHIDDQAARTAAPIVGATESEVAVMDTLTANLHLMMSSFYRPTEERYKILLESKAFPSDHYAVESQLSHHGLDPSASMILLSPDDPSGIISTTQILETINKHASQIALILLPGVQFYTGQFFDIATITAYAHSKDILIGWDLAHAIGNVELKLHKWEVDFAVWCSYKYLNAGPGATAGLFVHEKHGRVDMSAGDGKRYRRRLAGWWGADKETRFLMNNEFVPRPGAAGFQLSNPNTLGLSVVIAALEIFNEASMPEIRKKSLILTGYLEKLLDGLSSSTDFRTPPFEIITPRDPGQRGAQLSIRIDPTKLDGVLQYLEAKGVIVDERKPDVIRVAPAPLYNTFEDVWNFCQIFHEALKGGLNTPAATVDGDISKSGT